MKSASFSGENLKFLMDVTGVSSNKIAELLGVSLSSVKFWREGKLIPSVSNLMKLADFFAVPMDYLCDRCDIELAKAIQTDYKARFRELRTDAYDMYLTVGPPKLTFDSNVIAVWPYNLLEAIFQEPWEKPLNHFQEKGLEWVLDSLTERQKSSVISYFRDEETLESIGKNEGLTRERIRQIIAKSLRLMRHPAWKHRIVEGYDDTKTVEKALREKRELLEEKEKELEQKEQQLKILKETLDRREAVLNQKVQKITGYKASIETEPKNIQIEDLNLSVRSFHCLKRAKINTVQDILDYSDDLQNIKNLGQKSLNEIRTVVQRLTGADITI